MQLCWVLVFLLFVEVVVLKPSGYKSLYDELESTLEDDEGRKKNDSGFGSRGEKGHSRHENFDEGVRGRYGSDAFKGKYGERGVARKGFSHDGGFQSERNKMANGAKGFRFVENDHYSKGYSTKGYHVVHKLDEYKKDTDFYDEAHATAGKATYGGFNKSGGNLSGKYQKDGYLDNAYKGNAFDKDEVVGRFVGFHDVVGYLNERGDQDKFSGGGKIEDKFYVG